jgi:hypothetical protein
MAKREDPLKVLKGEIRSLKSMLSTCWRLVEEARQEKAEGDPEVARRLRARVSELEARVKGLEAERDGLRKEVERLPYEVQARLNELR